MQKHDGRSLNLDAGAVALQAAWEELDTSPVEPPDELAGAPTEL